LFSMSVVRVEMSINKLFAVAMAKNASSRTFFMPL
jgi:hypothetical protein